jgi:hypothetical protein
LHEHAATIQRICFAANEIEFRQTIERAGDRRLRHAQLGCKATDGLGLGF